MAKASNFQVGDIVSGYVRNKLFKISEIELRGEPSSPLLKGYIYDPVKNTVGKTLYAWDEGYSLPAEEFVRIQIADTRSILSKWENALIVLKSL